MGEFESGGRVDAIFVRAVISILQNSGKHMLSCKNRSSSRSFPCDLVASAMGLWDVPNNNEECKCTISDELLKPWSVVYPNSPLRRFGFISGSGQGHRHG